MTDVLDRAIAAEPGPQPEPSPETAAEERAAGTPAPPTVTGAGQWFLGAALLGAGAIHAAMAPSHLGESAVEGAGFVVAAWAQLLLAAAVLRRPGRWVLRATIALSLALVTAWVVSRTAGLPVGAHSGHPESVSLVDGVAVALEAIAVLLAVGLLAGLTLSVGKVRFAAIGGALGALAFATAAIASPSARDHAAGSHGAHGTDGHGGHAAGMDDGMAGAGHGHGTAAGETDDKGFSELANGHQHERGTEPMTPEETAGLAKELAVTVELMEAYPTIADAEAAGWRRAGPFAPGLGTHYGPPDYHLNQDGDMDREDLLNPMLVFDGLGPDAQLAGFMFMGYGDTAPEGFTGPNDHWHFHEKVCVVVNDGEIDTPFGADQPGLTEDMCTEVGGTFIDFTGYMVHVWNVPGYESPDGMFTELNRAITCPDGTYYRIPIEELGLKDSICRNP